MEPSIPLASRHSWRQRLEPSLPLASSRLARPKHLEGGRLEAPLHRSQQEGQLSQGPSPARLTLLPTPPGGQRVS